MIRWVDSTAGKPGSMVSQRRSTRPRLASPLISVTLTNPTCRPGMVISRSPIVRLVEGLLVHNNTLYRMLDYLLIQFQHLMHCQLQ